MREDYCGICGAKGDSRLVPDDCIRLMEASLVCMDCCEDCYMYPICTDCPFKQTLGDKK